MYSDPAAGARKRRPTKVGVRIANHDGEPALWSDPRSDHAGSALGAFHDLVRLGSIRAGRGLGQFDCGRSIWCAEAETASRIGRQTQRIEVSRACARGAA